MKLRAELEQDIVVLTVSGKILGIPQERAIFNGTIQEYLSLNKRNFVVDLDRVDRINSIGIGMLIAAYTSITRADGRFVLCNLNNIESILSLTRLITVFEHVEDCAEARWLFERPAQAAG